MQQFGDLVAVHLRHIYVKYDQVVILGGQAYKDLLPVFCELDVMARFVQHAP